MAKIVNKFFFGFAVISVLVVAGGGVGIIQLRAERDTRESYLRNIPVPQGSKFLGAAAVQNADKSSSMRLSYLCGYDRDTMATFYRIVIEQNKWRLDAEGKPSGDDDQHILVFTDPATGTKATISVSADTPARDKSQGSSRVTIVSTL